MVNEEGIVERVAAESAWVRIEKSGACASCSSRGACHALSEREMLVEVGNRLGAGPGDRVELSVPSGSLLKLSVLVYFVPVLALVVGAALAGAWAESAGMAQTLPAVVGGGVGLGMTLLILLRVGRTARSIGPMTVDWAWRGGEQGAALPTVTASRKPGKATPTPDSGADGTNRLTFDSPGLWYLHTRPAGAPAGPPPLPVWAERPMAVKETRPAAGGLAGDHDGWTRRQLAVLAGR